MFCDIVFPSNNETEFLSQAKILGIDGLCFVYSFNSQNVKSVVSSFKKLKEENKDANLFLGFSIKKGQEKYVRGVSDLILYEANKDLDVFRQNADVVFGFEKLYEKESIYHPLSGLSVSILRDSKSVVNCVGFSLNDVFQSRFSVSFFHKLRFNIFLCRKFKVNLLFGSFASSPLNLRSPTDISGFVRSLGGSSNQAKSAVDFCWELISLNQKKKSPDYLDKDIELEG